MAERMNLTNSTSTLVVPAPLNPNHKKEKGDHAENWLPEAGMDYRGWRPIQKLSLQEGRKLAGQPLLRLRLDSS